MGSCGSYPRYACCGGAPTDACRSGSVHTCYSGGSVASYRGGGDGCGSTLLEVLVSQQASGDDSSAMMDESAQV